MNKRKCQTGKYSKSLKHKRRYDLPASCENYKCKNQHELLMYIMSFWVRVLVSPPQSGAAGTTAASMY